MTVDIQKANIIRLALDMTLSQYEEIGEHKFLDRLDDIGVNEIFQVCEVTLPGIRENFASNEFFARKKIDAELLSVRNVLESERFWSENLRTWPEVVILAISILYCMERIQGAGDIRH